MIERDDYEIGQCPSPGQTRATDWRTPIAMQSTVVDEDHLEVVVYLLPEGRIAPDRIFTLDICPDGQVCACSYLADISWQAGSLCGVVFSWAWPLLGGCLLKNGQLVGSETGLTFAEQLAIDPGNPIYPIGDERNPDCPGCGMSGAERQSQSDTPVPGEDFVLHGCYDDETCIIAYGLGGCKSLGDSYYETTGFCGGEIAAILDEGDRRYLVHVKGENGTAYGTDLTSYQVGDFVALAKPECTFPLDDEGYQIAITDVNVCKADKDDYVILPFLFEGL